MTAPLAPVSPSSRRPHHVDGRSWRCPSDARSQPHRERTSTAARSVPIGSWPTKAHDHAPETARAGPDLPTAELGSARAAASTSPARKPRSGARRASRTRSRHDGRVRRSRAAACAQPCRARTGPFCGTPRRRSFQPPDYSTAEAAVRTSDGSRSARSVWMPGAPTEFEIERTASM
jgi:hypothetical protein